jgi:uncharacterized protein YicC (UPF0701 family)
MGMVEEMHNLCEDIVTSRFDRMEVIKGIKSDTGLILTDAKNILKDFNTEREKMGDELRSDLKEAVGTLREDTRGKLMEFGDARAEMSKEMAKELKEYTAGIRKDVTDLRSEAKGTVKGFADERNKMGSELRKEFGEYKSGIKKDVDDLVSDFSAAREETVKELRGMHEEWQKMVAAPRTAGVEGEAKVEEEVVEETLPIEEELKATALERINASPDGISLAKIGEEMGVDWRRLIRPTKELLHEGKVRKEDVNYFPIKEEEEEKEEKVEEAVEEEEERSWRSW